MSFKPNLESLNDRIAPHAGPWTMIPGAMSTFGIIASARSETERVASDFRILTMPSSESGVETRLLIVAVDANGRPVRDYEGTVTITSSDSAATLPEPVTFTANDRGRKVITLTLATEGEQTITVTDETGEITGEKTVTVQAPAVATGFTVKVERAAYAGAETRVLVAAVDADGKPVRSYAGTVTLTSSDETATMPESYTFTAADHGVHVFTYTPGTTGEQTVTATDDTGELTGEATITVNEAPTVAKVIAVARPVASTGSTVTLYLVAVDANNRPVRNADLTLTLSSETDGLNLPESVTFTPDDRGLIELEITMPTTAGEVAIRVTDGADLTDSVTIRVLDLPRLGGHGFGPRGFGRW